MTEIKRKKKMAGLATLRGRKFDMAFRYVIPTDMIDFGERAG